MPFYRLNWPDGTNFDYSNDEAALRREIARVAPDDLDGYDDFLDYAAGVYKEGYVKLGHVPFLDFASMIKAAPALAKLSGVALGLFDGFVVHQERETARGAVVPHPAGRRQSDDDQRDLCPDPQAGEGRRRVVGQGRHQPAGRGHGHPFRAAGRHDAARRSGGARPHHRRPGERGRNGERLARAVRRGRQQCRHHAHLPRSAVRRAARQGAWRRSWRKKRFSPSLFVVHFGLEGHLAGHPAPHDPVRPALQGTARRHLRSRRAAAGFLDLSPPPDRHRSIDGARGQEHVLCAGAGRASGQAADRLGRGRAAARKAHSRRGRAPADPRHP